MKNKIEPKWFHIVCSSLIESNARSVTKYLTDKMVVRATWRHKPSARHTREEMVVTYGAPNYIEAKFVKACKKAGEPFPIKKIQFRPFPKKRPVA